MGVYKSLEEAVAISCENAAALDSEYLHINDVFMRVAADNIVSPINIPGFDRSAMDGYTIGWTDMEKLKTGSSLSLKITATIKAGSTECKQIKTGETYRIMTGALIPEGCAAVLKQEDVQINGNTIVVTGGWKPGENIQKAGYELRAGDKVAAKGQVLSVEILERAAACGIDKILVHKIPRIYVINTGSELILPGLPIKKGQIYNSNRTLLSGKIVRTGAIPLPADSIIEDDLQAIMNEIEKAALVSDMVIISGGTGNGVYDLVYDAFEHLNARTLLEELILFPVRTHLLQFLMANSCIIYLAIPVRQVYCLKF